MTQNESVHVTAPSRLHFGLLSFGNADDPQFGGVGVMIDQPRVILSARLSDRVRARGPFSERVVAVAERVLKHLKRPDFGAEFNIDQVPRPHVGLGTGTQITLSVAKALYALLGVCAVDAPDLAKATGRGRRSAVGTHGFGQGGMIFEEGKRPEESVARLAARVEMPSTWRFMLLIPAVGEGVSGECEARAFDHLPPVPKETTAKLRRIAAEELLPAAEQADFDTYSDAVYRYGHEAGLCFATQQDGAYASRHTHRIVNSLRTAGIAGVGQSSWGPTVYALVRQEDADEAMRLGRALLPGDDSGVLLAAPDAQGAILSVKVQRA